MYLIERGVKKTLYTLLLEQERAYRGIPFDLQPFFRHEYLPFAMAHQNPRACREE
jgi:hypothetical protein